MVQAIEELYVSYEDYVTAEIESTVKHEWLDGLVYAMAGGRSNMAGLPRICSACSATRSRATAASTRRIGPLREGDEVLDLSDGSVTAER